MVPFDIWIRILKVFARKAWERFEKADVDLFVDRKNK